MKKYESGIISAFIISLFSILLVSCPHEINPPEPRPDGVRIKAHNGATFPVETGLRPLEGVDERIRIEWSPLPNNENNLIEEYFIFRSNGPDSPYVQIGNRLVEFAEEDSFFIDEHVFEDVPYSYFVMARNSKDKFTDTSSYFGNEEFIKSIQLGHKVEYIIAPPADTANTKPTFTWCTGRLSPAPLKYLVKLATPSGQIIWIAEKQIGVFDSECLINNNFEYMTFHNNSYTSQSTPMDSLKISGTLNVTVHYINPAFFDGGRLLKNNSYLWRVDAVFDGAESKSRWSAFSVTKDYINPN